MTKRTQNLKPDIILKNYWNDNEQFADLFNAVLFGGKQVIRPEKLEDVDTEESYEMLNISEVLKAFVNDYKVLFVEARENNLIFHNVKNAAFFNMMKMFLDKSLPKDEARKKVIDYARDHNVDKSVIMAVAGAANCRIDYNALSRKGEFDMWTFFDEIAKEGEMKGKAEGIIETGFDCGLSESDILERLQKKLNVSLQTAQEYIKMFGKQTV